MLGFGAAMTALAALFWIGCQSLLRLQDSSEWVTHTFDVISHIRLMESDLHEAQAGLRGFLLTQQPEFLELSKSSLFAIPTDLAEAAEMTRDNPRQRDAFERFTPLLAQITDRIQKTVGLCSAGHLKEALELFRSGDLSRDNQIAQKLIQGIIVEEQTLLSQRERIVAKQTRFALGMFIVGCALFMAFFAIGLWAINHEFRQKEDLEAYLQAEEHRLFQYLEAVPLGIFVADKNAKPYYANQKAKELLGKGLLPNVPIEQQAEIYQLYRAGSQEVYPMDLLPLIKALKGEKVMNEDMEIHHPDGTVIPLQVWGTPVYDETGGIPYAMVVFNDISERKKFEEMSRNLISIVSHQLKTPVGEINGYIENLLEGIAGELGEKQKDYLLDMREIGLNNFRLISDLLNLSKIERGLIRSESKRVPLDKTVELALRDYEKIIQRKGLSLALLGLDQGLEVMADQDKLIETLRNLVNNAVKFTDKGGITLKAEKAGSIVRLMIQDTGVGISDASLAQLFSRKKVLGAEASRAGAGLGLYVAKYFMNLQGGDITATTEKGKGSCFTLTLPGA